MTGAACIEAARAPLSAWWRRRAAAAALALVAFVPAADAADSASILVYHRFGVADFAATNIRLDQFEGHLETLREGGYTVLPVAEIVAAVRKGRALPERTVGITIDGAYLSAYTEAWPRLRRAGFPFTLFVSTGAVERGYDGQMSWEQIREMQASGVEIGHQTASRLHMAANSAARNRQDIARANEHFTTALGAAPRLFAYPFGEASAEVQDVVRAAGFDAAFGQHSGVVHGTSDPFYLPRFALNEQYGDPARFRLVSGAQAIPVSDLTPADPTLARNPPLFGFTVGGGIEDLSRLACYASGQGKVTVERLGPRIEVRMAEPFPAGRARINCTMPAADGRWRWLGMQYYVPKG